MLQEIGRAISLLLWGSKVLSWTAMGSLCLVTVPAVLGDQVDCDVGVDVRS